jgi:hypothetical protein
MTSSFQSEVPPRHSSRTKPGPGRDKQNNDMSVATMLQPASRASTSSSSSFQPVTRQNTLSSHDGRSVRQSKRISMTALYVSMSAKEKDLEISDDLARAQRTLRDLKAKISSQSKKNFVLEKDVRYLDSRIALLIANRMALEEVSTSQLRRGELTNFGHSKMKSRAILTKRLIFKKVHSRTTRRRKNMAICSSCCNLNPGI